MGRFLEAEKIRQTAFKQSSLYFSEWARLNGQYSNREYPFFLPEACAEENLYNEIRQSATRYFADHNIQWHQLRAHLCSSQICCINFLEPFATYPDALKLLLLPLFPTIKRLLPMEQADRFVSFEWIGLENYLGEKIRGGSRRTRGANFTSTDGAVLFERNDGTRQIVLIEWKYTEAYSSQSKEIASSGTDRKQIYAKLFHQPDCPLDKDILPSYASLFYEPFYQLMRQQFLAHEMERAHELGASEVVVLHIAPQHNTDFLKVTSPELIGLGTSAIGVWKRIVKNEKFKNASTEGLFGAFPITEFPEMSNWWRYINARYPWIH
jgi:hypothetical protein